MKFWNPHTVNLVVCGGVSFWSVVFFVTQRGPKKALRPECMQSAFLLWIANWLILALVYLNLCTGQPIPNWLCVAGLNLGDTLWIGFFLVYVFGDDFSHVKDASTGGKHPRPKTRGVVYTLGWIFALCFAIVAVGEMGHWRDKDAVLGVLEISFPNLLSSVSGMLMAWAFVARYGMSLVAVAAFIISLFYAWFQLPAYLNVYAFKPPGDLDWLNVGMYCLAGLKLLLGAVCLTMFASPFWWISEDEKFERVDPAFIDKAEFWPGDFAKPVMGRGRSGAFWLISTILVPLAIQIVGVVVEKLLEK